MSKKAKPAKWSKGNRALDVILTWTVVLWDPGWLTRDFRLGMNNARIIQTNFVDSENEQKYVNKEFRIQHTLNQYHFLSSPVSRAHVLSLWCTCALTVNPLPSLPCCVLLPFSLPSLLCSLGWGFPWDWGHSFFIAIFLLCKCCL